MTLDDDFMGQLTRIYRMFVDNEDFSGKLDLPEHYRFLMHLIGHHMCALKYSNVFVGTGENDGTTVYPALGCFFRHSCFPNVALVTSDQSIIAVTIRPIQENQELTVSYLSDDLLDSVTFMRRGILQEHFNFRCKCERCKNRSTRVTCKQNGLGQQFIEEVQNESNFHPKMQKIRKKLTQTCVKYLSGNAEWSDEVSIVMSTYYRLIREKYYLKIRH